MRGQSAIDNHNVVGTVDNVMTKNAWFHEITDDSEMAKWKLPDGAIARLGQGRVMGNIAPSPDRKYLAVASCIGVWWYDIFTMTPITLCDTDRGFISAVSFSPNGKWLATGDGDGLVKVWDVQRGICIAQMERDEEERPYHLVSHLVFSLDGQRLTASSVRDYILYVWHPETGEWLAKFHDETDFKWFGGTPRPITFSEDGSLLASTMPDESLVAHADPNGTIRLSKDATEFIAVWNVETGGQIACLTNTNGFVNSLRFSPCGQFLAAGGADGSVRVWSVDNWQQTHGYYDYGTGQMQVFYSPAGILHAAEKSDDTFVVWDVARGKKCDLSVEEHSSLQGVHVRKGTPFVLASTTRREFRKWTVGNSDPHSFPHLHTGVPFSLAFSPDGKTLAGGYWSEGEKVILWDITDLSSPSSCFNLPGGSYTISVSPQGKIYATGADGKTAKLWNIGNNATPVATFTLPYEEIPFAEQKLQVSTTAFAHKSNLLACGDSEGRLYVWNVQRQNTQYTFKAHSEWINFIAFSPDEKKIVSMTRYGPVSQLWDVESGEPIEALPKRNYAFAFSPCSTLIALGQINPSRILLWDISQRETLMSIPQRKDSSHPYALAFSPCGRYLASGAWWLRGFGIKKCPVRLWNVKSGENIATFRGHCSDVQCLAFSPDGTILASGSYDGTILLWDLKPYL